MRRLWSLNLKEPVIKHFEKNQNTNMTRENVNATVELHRVN